MITEKCVRLPSIYLTLYIITSSTFFLNAHTSIYVIDHTYPHQTDRHVKMARDLRQQRHELKLNQRPQLFSTGMTRAKAALSHSRVTPSSSLITSRSQVVTFCCCVRRLTCYYLNQPTTLTLSNYTFTYSPLHSYIYTTHPPTASLAPVRLTSPVGHSSLHPAHRRDHLQPHLSHHLTISWIHD